MEEVNRGDFGHPSTNQVFIFDVESSFEMPPECMSQATSDYTSDTQINSNVGLTSNKATSRKIEALDESYLYYEEICRMFQNEIKDRSDGDYREGYSMFHLSDVSCHVLIHPEFRRSGSPLSFENDHFSGIEESDNHSSIDEVLIPDIMSVPMKGKRCIHLNVPISAYRYWIHLISCEASFKTHDVHNHDTGISNGTDGSHSLLQFEVHTSTADFVLHNDYNNSISSNSETPMKLRFHIQNHSIFRHLQSTDSHSLLLAEDSSYNDRDLAHQLISEAMSSQNENKDSPFIPASINSAPTTSSAPTETVELSFPECKQLFLQHLQYEQQLKSSPTIHIVPFVVTMIVMIICFIDLYVNTLQRRFGNRNAKSPLHTLILKLLQLWHHIKDYSLDMSSKCWIDIIVVWNSTKEQLLNYLLQMMVVWKDAKDRLFDCIFLLFHKSTKRDGECVIPNVDVEHQLASCSDHSNFRDKDEAVITDFDKFDEKETFSVNDDSLPVLATQDGDDINTYVDEACGEVDCLTEMTHNEKSSEMQVYTNDLSSDNLIDQPIKSEEGKVALSSLKSISVNLEETKFDDWQNKQEFSTSKHQDEKHQDQDEKHQDQDEKHQDEKHQDEKPQDMKARNVKNNHESVSLQQRIDNEIIESLKEKELKVESLGSVSNEINSSSDRSSLMASKLVFDADDLKSEENKLPSSCKGVTPTSTETISSGTSSPRRSLSPCSKLQHEWFLRKMKRDDGKIRTENTENHQHGTVSPNFSSLLAKWSKPINSSNSNNGFPAKDLERKVTSKRVTKVLSPKMNIDNISHHNGQDVPLSFLSDLLE